jgi:hypothetical protein
MNERVAVDFGGGGEEESRAFMFGEAEGFVRAEGTDLQGLNWNLEVIDGTGGRGEVPDVIDVFVQEDEFGDVLLNEAEVLVAAEVRNVIDVAGDKIIEADDFVPLSEQVIGEM